MSLLRTVLPFAKPKRTQTMAATGPLSARSKGSLGGSHLIKREHRCEHLTSQLANGLFYLMTCKNASEKSDVYQKSISLRVDRALSRERPSETADKGEIFRHIATTNYTFICKSSADVL